MTDLDLAAIKARAQAATPGPWEERVNDLTDEVTVEHDNEHRFQIAWIDGDYRNKWAMTDAEFIAHAREDIPALIAEIERLRAQVQDARDVHQPLEALNVRSNRLQKVCTGCGTDDGNWQHYPCPTIRALGVEP